MPIAIVCCCSKFYQRKLFSGGIAAGEHGAAATEHREEVLLLRCRGRRARSRTRRRPSAQATGQIAICQIDSQPPGSGGTRSLWSGYGICRGFAKLLLQSTAQRLHQLWRGSRKLVAQALLQKMMAQALLQSTPLFRGCRSSTPPWEGIKSGCYACGGSGD